MFKIQLFCRFITQLVKKLQQLSFYEVIEGIFPLVLKRPLSDIWMLRYKKNKIERVIAIIVCKGEAKFPFLIILKYSNLAQVLTFLLNYLHVSSICKYQPSGEGGAR